MSAASPSRQSEKVCPPYPALQSNISSTQAQSHLVDRWDLLSDVKEIHAILGLTDREIAVLNAHLTVLKKGPVDTTKATLSFKSVSSLLERASCMEERRFRRGEERLESVGLIIRSRSANGRRYALRDDVGEIVGGYGFDLAPLFARAQEFHDRAKHARAELSTHRNLRSVIRDCLADIGRGTHTKAEDLGRDMSARVTEVLKILRRKRTTINELEAINIEVRRMTIDWESGFSEMNDDPTSDPDAPQEAEAQVILPDTVAADDGQSVRHIESQRNEDTDSDGSDQNHEEARVKKEIDKAWAASPNVLEFYPNPPRSGSELESYLMSFLSFIGIDWHTTQKAISRFGIGGCIEVLDDLAGRIFILRNPSGYLISIIRSFEMGRAVACGRVRQITTTA